MTDNTRESHPYIYTGSIQDKEGKDSDKYGFGDYTDNMNPCGYCGIWFSKNHLERIAVTRNGKRREMFRCVRCREEMYVYKETFGLT